MRRISNAEVGLENGQKLLFSAFEDNGEMWAGEGPRVIRSPVRFDQTFLDAPTVHVSVAMLDMDSGANHRFDLQAERVTASGFDIIFRTWGDTRVARVRVSWLAIGSVAYRDNWDVI